MIKLPRPFADRIVNTLATGPMIMHPLYHSKSNETHGKDYRRLSRFATGA